MCYFTSGCGLHRVVTAICLPPLNHHYSDAAGDDVLGGAHSLRLRLPAYWIIKYSSAETVEAAVAVIFSPTPAVLFFQRDTQKLLTHNVAPFVSLIFAFYPLSLLLRRRYGNLCFHRSLTSPAFSILFFFFFLLPPPLSPPPPLLREISSSRCLTYSGLLLTSRSW